MCCPLSGQGVCLKKPCWLDALIEFGICSRYTNVCSCRDAYRCAVNLLAEISIIENLFYVKLLSGKCETRMVLGFRKQSNKDTKVQRSRRSATPGSRVSYATGEAVVARPVQPRKRLPRSSKRSVNVVRQQRSGITAGWRLQGLWEPDQQDASAQAISEEEQKKLAELELDMRLPRVAGKIDSWLLIIVLVLLCTGLVMVYSASSFVAARAYGDASYFFQKQLLMVILGISAMLVTMRIDYRQWRRFSLAGMVVILPLLIIVLIFGHTVYGASRWLTFGSFFSIQPSEVAKLILALYIADWLARKGNQVSTFLYGLAPFVILVGVVLGLVLLENDMGTAIVIAGFATAMFFTAGANIVQTCNSINRCWRWVPVAGSG